MPPRTTKLPPKARAVQPDGSLLAEYRDLDARLGRDLTTKTLTASEVAKLVAARRAILEKIGLLTGEGQVTESQILKSPAWERLVKAMVEALRPYPDAARAVTDALARVVGDHGQEKPRKRSPRGD